MTIANLCWASAFVMGLHAVSAGMWPSFCFYFLFFLYLRTMTAVGFCKRKKIIPLSISYSMRERRIEI
jgi:hypothetical protein